MLSWRILLPCIALTFLLPSKGFSREEYARREGMRCSACHCDEYGKTPLNKFGQRYKTWSGLLPDEKSRFWIPGAMSPNLTAAQVRLLYRKYLKQGKRLFRYDRLGKKTISCSTCHSLDPVGTAAGKMSTLGKIFQRYPRYRPETRSFVTVGQAINICIDKHMKGRPFRLGSPALVALEQYLKSRSSRTP